MGFHPFFTSGYLVSSRTQNAHNYPGQYPHLGDGSSVPRTAALTADRMPSQPTTRSAAKEEPSEKKSVAGREVVVVVVVVVGSGVGPEGAEVEVVGV